MNERSSVAVVTGASRGIGLAVTKRLADAGRTVVAVARRAATSDELLQIVGVVPISLDVTDSAAVAAAAATIESTIGPIDLLINNAGVAGGGGSTWSQEPESWWQVFEVNVLGTFNCCRYLVPAMVNRGYGRVVNVSSNAGFFAIDDEFDLDINTAYMSSKAAVIRFSESLAAETHSSGVKVFCVSPGTVKTDMTTAIFADYWDDPNFTWTEPDVAASLIDFIAGGALDRLSGRYIHAANDDWHSLTERVDSVISNDLMSLRLTTEE